MQEFDEEVSQFIQEQGLIRKGNRILVACSGGVDSMALLHYLGTNQARFEIEVGAVHVDHMLRGQASYEDGQLVRAHCELLGVPFYSGSIPVPKIVDENGGNIQQVCRKERYNFFEQVMGKKHYEVLATAHHGEDQLETILMQVTRGASPLGMPIHRDIVMGKLIRPFLSVNKKQLYHYAKVQEIPFHEDPSNQEDDYMRNRYRHHIIPRMFKENPAIINGITPLTAQLQEDEKFLQQMAKDTISRYTKFTDEGYPSMSIENFHYMPTALQRRAIPLLLDYLYNKEDDDVFYKNDLINQLLKHLHSDEGNVKIDLPNGYQFKRSYDQFTFELKVNSQRKEKVLPKGKKVYWGHDIWLYWIEVEKMEPEVLLKAKDVAFFNLPEESFPLQVRRRQDGDRMFIKGMTHAKRISRILIDEKVDRSLRDELPIVTTSQGEICAVLNVRYGSYFTKQQTPESKYIFITGIQ